jgi:hypothetical protein
VSVNRLVLEDCIVAVEAATAQRDRLWRVPHPAGTAGHSLTLDG